MFPGLAEYISKFERAHLLDYAPKSTAAGTSSASQVRKLRRFNKRKHEAPFADKFRFVIQELFDNGGIKRQSSVSPHVQTVLRTSWEVCCDLAAAAASEMGTEAAKHHLTLMCSTACAMLILAVPFISPKEAYRFFSPVARNAMELTTLHGVSGTPAYRYVGPAEKTAKNDDALLRLVLSKTGPFFMEKSIGTTPVSAKLHMKASTTSLLEDFLCAKTGLEKLEICQALFVRRVVVFLWESHEAKDAPFASVEGIDDGDALTAALAFERTPPVELFREAYEKATPATGSVPDLEDMGSFLASRRRALDARLHLPPCVAFAKLHKPEMLKNIEFAKTHGLIGAMAARARKPKASDWHDDVHLYRDKNIVYRPRRKPVQLIKGARFFAPREKIVVDDFKKIIDCGWMRQRGVCPFAPKKREDKANAHAVLQIYYDAAGVSDATLPSQDKCSALAGSLGQAFFLSALEDPLLLNRLEDENGPRSYPPLHPHQPAEFTRKTFFKSK